MSGKICIPNKAKHVNLNAFNLITRTNESKILIKVITKNSKKCSSNQIWKNDRYRFECQNPKEHNACGKGYIWNPATCSCENGRYAGSIIDDSVITCDEIMETAKGILTKNCSNKKYSNKF